jgi:hypothetical protein
MTPKGASSTGVIRHTNKNIIANNRTRAIVFPVDVAIVNLLFRALFQLQGKKSNVLNIRCYHSFMPILNDDFVIETFGESQV